MIVLVDEKTGALLCLHKTTSSGERDLNLTVLCVAGADSGAVCESLFLSYRAADSVQRSREVQLRLAAHAHAIRDTLPDRGLTPSNANMNGRSDVSALAAIHFLHAFHSSHSFVIP